MLLEAPSSAPGGIDIVLLKVSNAGVYQWTYHHGTSGDDQAQDMVRGEGRIKLWSTHGGTHEWIMRAWSASRFGICMALAPTLRIIESKPVRRGSH